MPRAHKGGWKWNICAVFILADRIRANDSSTLCARAIMEQQRTAYPGMELDNNSIIAAMRSKTVPGLIQKVCPDHEIVIQKFHTPKTRGGKGSAGKRRCPSAPPKKPGPINAQVLMAFRQKQNKNPAP
jgi:hypothetical protein